MMNAVNTTQRMRRKERHKFSRTMAVILGLYAGIVAILTDN